LQAAGRTTVTAGVTATPTSSKAYGLGFDVLRACRGAATSVLQHVRFRGVYGTKVIIICIVDKHSIRTATDAADARGALGLTLR